MKLNEGNRFVLTIGFIYLFHVTATHSEFKYKIKCTPLKILRYNS